MRPGEVGQLKCADIRTDGEFFYFDLRPFDAREGRVAVQDLRNLKTNAAGRVIPIHPLLIELGLLDRMNELMDKGEERLFPEWECYVRKDGTQRWSQPLSKSWQYVKKLLELRRADLTLYSTRHLMADWLDNEAIAQRTHDRILGHASDVRSRYGRKGIFDPQIAAKIEALETAGGQADERDPARGKEPRGGGRAHGAEDVLRFQVRSAILNGAPFRIKLRTLI
jgi:integrase